MRQNLFYILSLVLLLTGCDKTLHDIPEEHPSDNPTITIGINTDAIQGTPLRDVHLYFFDSSEMLAKHIYYPTMQSLALDRMLMESGYYTIFAILNTEESLVPTVARSVDVPKISFASFCQWVKSLDNGSYPDLATGLVRYEVKEGVSLITIDVKKGSEAVELSTLTLNLTFPSPMLDYVKQKKSRSVGDVEMLRAVIELYKKGTNERVLRKEEFVTQIGDENVYTATLLVTPGTYDIRLWADYTTEATTDNHYITTNTQDVKILPKEQYLANTDTKDAFVTTQILTIDKTEQIENITMNRPVAKYRLVATDLEKYETLRKQRNYPPIEELNISVVYESYLPAGYDMWTGTLTDSQMGYGYNSAISENTDTMVTLAKDFVLVNGEESGVQVKLLLKDSTGKVISGVSGIIINYRSGYLTTIKGDFLTAGKGGVDIVTEWEGEYNVEF